MCLGETTDLEGLLDGVDSREDFWKLAMAKDEFLNIDAFREVKPLRISGSLLPLLSARESGGVVKNARP